MYFLKNDNNNFFTKSEVYNQKIVSCGCENDYSNCTNSILKTCPPINNPVNNLSSPFNISPINNLIPLSITNLPIISNCSYQTPLINSTSFYCFNNSWISNHTIITSNDISLDILGLSQINGNLITNSLINFGINGSLVISKCLINFTKSIYLNLTQQELQNIINGETLNKTFIKEAKNCSFSYPISNIIVKTMQLENSCKKILTKNTNQNNFNILQNVIYVNNSCNQSKNVIWPIILGSIVGFFVLIIITAAIIIIPNRRLRLRLQHYLFNIKN